MNLCTYYSYELDNWIHCIVHAVDMFDITSVKTQGLNPPMGGHTSGITDSTQGHLYSYS
jgi:hypothetical protein